MYYWSTLFIFLCIVFIQLNSQQNVVSASVSSSIDDNEENQSLSEPSLSLLISWYNQLHDLNKRNHQESFDHLWKRYIFERPPMRERRRFGNTRYGRSVP